MKLGYYPILLVVVITALVGFIMIGVLTGDKYDLSSVIPQNNPGLCGYVSEDLVFYPDIEGDTHIKSNIPQRDVCYIELAEPSDEGIILCEEVSDSIVNFCEEGCYEIPAKEACYRIAFGDFKSYPQPPRSGDISKIETCEKLSDFRDNCYYLVAVNTKDISVCGMISSQGRADLCKENLG